MLNHSSDLSLSTLTCRATSTLTKLSWNALYIVFYPYITAGKAAYAVGSFAYHAPQKVKRRLGEATLTDKKHWVEENVESFVSVTKATANVTAPVIWMVVTIPRSIVYKSRDLVIYTASHSSTQLVSKAMLSSSSIVVRTSGSIAYKCARGAASAATYSTFGCFQVARSSAPILCSMMSRCVHTNAWKQLETLVGSSTHMLASTIAAGMYSLMVAVFPQYRHTITQEDCAEMTYYIIMEMARLFGPQNVFYFFRFMYESMTSEEVWEYVMMGKVVGCKAIDWTREQNLSLLLPPADALDVVADSISLVASAIEDISIELERVCDYLESGPNEKLLKGPLCQKPELSDAQVISGALSNLEKCASKVCEPYLYSNTSCESASPSSIVSETSYKGKITTEATFFSDQPIETVLENFADTFYDTTICFLSSAADSDIALDFVQNVEDLIDIFLK